MILSGPIIQVIYICGGVKINTSDEGEIEYQFQPVTHLILIKIEEKEIIQMNLHGDVSVDFKISNCSLTFRPGTSGKLLLFGGSFNSPEPHISDNHAKNSQLMWISLKDNSITATNLPAEYTRKAAVAGSSVHWYSNNTAILTGHRLIPRNVL